MNNKTRGFWRNLKGYKRLNESSRRSRIKSIRIGSTESKKSWRLKILPKLRLLKTASWSPKKLLVWLRDAYVKMMMKLANSRVASTGYGGPAGNGFSGFGRSRSVKEYDPKVIGEIYKSIVMSKNQLVPREAGNLNPQLFCSLQF